MKIAQAVVDMQSSHEYSRESDIQWTSESSFRTVFAQVSAESPVPAVGERQEALLWRIEKLIARLLELLTAKSGEQSGAGDCELEAGAGVPLAGTSEQPGRQVEMEWKSEMTERICERESTRYACTGSVKTADGCVLDFNLDLAMNREYAAERHATESGKAVLRDPLVINFAGKAAELSGKSISFDLNADGECEAIPGLGACSGYLAIDRNADGRINDGSELFGTRSGDGFADLDRLDSDGNRWLDENDAAYAALRVWKQDVAGEQSLASLREAGVGAVYLGSAETPFDLKDKDNQLLGRIRASGIYLGENGSVGSVQQVDLAV